MIGTDCTELCKRPTPAQAHCSVCHRTFGGATGFDAHRVNGLCVDPVRVGFADRGDGIWRSPMDEQAHERMRLMREQRGKDHEPTVR